jgi:hypothetical protein
MKKILFIGLSLITIFFVNGCKPEINKEAEKAAIIKTLNDETKFFFKRDYPAWKSTWVQEEFVTKYIHENDGQLLIRNNRMECYQ